MTSVGILVLICATAIVPGDAAASDTRWGNLKGQFVYDGQPPLPVPLAVPAAVLGNNPNPVDESLLVDPKGGIANIVVFVRTKGVQANPRALKDVKAQVELTAKGARFEPHILPLMTTQTLVVQNAENFQVNPNVTELRGPGINPLLVPGDNARYMYLRPQMMGQPVTCNIHPWYKAYVLALDNPYFAVSRTDGSFEIKGLPLGDIEFQVWHERSGWVATGGWPKGRFRMHINEGDNDLGEIKLAPRLFKR
jgi:hypothetical protein